MNDEIKTIQDNLPDESTIYDLADFFKVLGDSTRAKILSCLEVKELCVYEISACLNMTKSAVSHQLHVLRQAKLVKTRKDGKEVYYSLDDDHVSKIFQYGLEHIKE